MYYTEMKENLLQKVKTATGGSTSRAGSLVLEDTVSAETPRVSMIDIPPPGQTQSAIPIVARSSMTTGPTHGETVTSSEPSSDLVGPSAPSSDLVGPSAPSSGLVGPSAPPPPSSSPAAVAAPPPAEPTNEPDESADAPEQSSDAPEQSADAPEPTVDASNPESTLQIVNEEQQDFEDNEE
jgi:hypothetical protein